MASSGETSQTNDAAVAVTRDSVAGSEKVTHAAPSPAVTVRGTSGGAMDVAPQPVMDGAGGALSGGPVGGDGGAVCTGDGASSADGVDVSGGEEAPVSELAGVVVPSPACGGEIQTLSAPSVEHSEKRLTKSDDTGAICDESSVARSTTSSKLLMGNSLPRTSCMASTDVTMATADPAIPAPLSASEQGPSSAGTGEVAASGALAMLAGYSSDEDDDNGTAEAEAPGPAGPEATVDRRGLYRDSLAWSGDSDSDSDSSADSSDSCSSSDPESEPAGETDDRAEEEDGETDQARRVFGPMTKGELCLLDLPPIEHLHIVLPEEQCTKVGTVASVVDCLVVVQSVAGCPALDIDSVLFLERGRRPLGRVYDVMGPVAQAAYCVRFNSPQEIAEFAIEPGAEVYFAPGSPEYSHFVFVEALRKMRGSDASWWDSNEPPENCLDFSDDEEERNHKRQTQKRPPPECAGRPPRGRGEGPPRPPWMPPPPANPFYRRPDRARAGPRMHWQHSQPPPPGPFSQPPPPPPPPLGFGQPPPPFPGRPPFCLPPGGPPPNQPPPGGLPPNQPPPPGLPPGGPSTNQPPPPGLPPGGLPPNQPLPPGGTPPPWSRPAFWGGR